MTIGQRIAQKRKELGLSQESLGEQLGVSRQAIYKWESDATLPEIEKLIALSRSFGVSVGWLLGEEEELSAPKELSEEQLLMVQEIVDRYLAARSESEADSAPSWWPEPECHELSPEQLRLVTAVADRVQANQPPQEPPKRRMWPKVLGAIACVVLIVLLFNLFERLNSLSNQYHYLQSTISSVEYGVSSQIGSITRRVEELLKNQNDLTADYNTQVVSVDPAAGMVTFSYRVVPKTYQPGMVAWIDIVNGGSARITYGPFDPVQQVFSGEVTIGLTDHTDIYIAFEYGGIRQTQLLDTYEDLYTSSFSAVYLDTWPLFFDIDDNTNTLTEDLYADLPQYLDENHTTQVASYRVGLFADRELVAWFTPITRTVIVDDAETEEETHCLSKEGILFDRGKEYCIAAVVVDEYGREFIVSDIPIRWSNSGWGHSTSYSTGPFFDGWTY